MEYNDIQLIEDKLVKVVYNTARIVEKGPKCMPQDLFQKHIKNGYSRANPAIIKLYKGKLDRLIIEYIKTIILYVFHNDITNLTHTSARGKRQKFIEFSTNMHLPETTDGEYTHMFGSILHYIKEDVPLVYVDFDRNIVDIPWVGYSAVGTKYEYEFVRNANSILRHVYRDICDNTELMCWLTLAGLDLYSIGGNYV